MITLYTGATKRFPTDLSNEVTEPISNINGIRALLGYSANKTKRLKEWRYPTETGYGVIDVVNDVDRLIEFALDVDDTINAEEGVLDLEIGIKDDDSMVGEYVTIAVSYQAFQMKKPKVYN